MNKLTKFIIAIALQVVIIFAIIILRVSILTGGTEVLLKIAPVDPTSPLRGDYVTFRYNISNISSYYLNSLQLKNGDIVYVILRNIGKYWDVKDVRSTQPTETDIIFIKGRVLSQSGGNVFDAFSTRVVYGVEDYFIPEGKGRNFSFVGKEVAASVAVDENGNAVLKRIYVDDKPWP